MHSGISFEFQKYQGTGNDFIIVKDLDGALLAQLDEARIKEICDRRFGIGADGFIAVLQENQESYCMVYFNSDGRESSMCGNGGRCFAAFLHNENLVVQNEIHFLAIDGHHVAYIKEEGLISLHMKDPVLINLDSETTWLDTGSPHIVKKIMTSIETFDVKSEGAKIRYAPRYAPGGVNANFVEYKNGKYFLRTYERGVEDETLSCGTGACAAAISIAYWNHLEGMHSISLQTPGGELEVSLRASDGLFSNVILTGPAMRVFQGVWKNK
jgi:diaminopimelate epimerase